MCESHDMESCAWIRLKIKLKFEFHVLCIQYNKWKKQCHPTLHWKVEMNSIPKNSLKTVMHVARAAWSRLQSK